MEPKRTRVRVADPDETAERAPSVRPPDRGTGRSPPPTCPACRSPGSAGAGSPGSSAAIVSVWIVAVFARQVGDAAAAADRADRLRIDNATLVSQVDDLQKELDLIGRQAFIEQQARAYGLGDKAERPFTLGAGCLAAARRRAGVGRRSARRHRRADARRSTPGSTSCSAPSR